MIKIQKTKICSKTPKKIFVRTNFSDFGGASQPPCQKVFNPWSEWKRPGNTWVVYHCCKLGYILWKIAILRFLLGLNPYYYGAKRGDFGRKQKFNHSSLKYFVFSFITGVLSFFIFSRFRRGWTEASQSFWGYRESPREFRFTWNPKSLYSVVTSEMSTQFNS